MLTYYKYNITQNILSTYSVVVEDSTSVTIVIDDSISIQYTFRIPFSYRNRSKSLLYNMDEVT